jgi:acyl-CoA thioesterase
MTKQPPTDEQRLILRFERARDEAPMSEAEAREFLGELGVDVDAEFRLLMKNVTAQEEADRLQELADAEAEYQRHQVRPKGPTHRRSRPENQARIRAQQARHPELSAHHHDLTHMSDDDLASLADQLEELEADAGEE